ncbi:unnamed protein product [Auanema sp. JU1783]|nr:unnamed protein product [Auanema sp. JU1783]
MGGTVGCVVTGTKLYSNGNFIRDLQSTELEVLTKYKKDMAAFKSKIDEAFENAEKIEANNSTIPPMPIKPNMPTFCTGPDTTMYIFGGCTVQNNKVYVGKILARELDNDEKKKLVEFAKKVAEKSKKGEVPTSDLYKGLEFCTEF